jgi:hypothetical protein
MRAALIFLMGLTFSLSGNADITAEIEFQQRMKAMGNSISSDKAGETDYCRKLADRIQSNFRPQQNYMAKEQYQRECLGEEERAIEPVAPFDR